MFGRYRSMQIFHQRQNERKTILVCKTAEGREQGEEGDKEHLLISSQFGFSKNCGYCCEIAVHMLEKRSHRQHFFCTYEPSRSLRSSKGKLLKISKRNLKSLGNVLLGSWRRLFGTHYQPISEIFQHYLSSNLTSKPSCSPRLSRSSSTPDYRLCICICFVCF